MKLSLEHISSEIGDDQQAIEDAKSTYYLCVLGTFYQYLWRFRTPGNWPDETKKNLSYFTHFWAILRLWGSF